MKRAYASKGSTATGQKKRKPPSQGKTKQNSGKTKGFEQSGLGQKKPKVQKSYGFLETLKTLRKKHSFHTAELAARKDKPRRLPARDEKMTWEPTKNVGIPYVS